MARAPCLALAPAHPTCLAHNLWAFQLHCYGDLPGRQGRAPAVPASYCIKTPVRLAFALTAIHQSGQFVLCLVHGLALSR
jgi:hypothetical protein